jgi:hypothetical protein
MFGRMRCRIWVVVYGGTERVLIDSDSDLHANYYANHHDDVDTYEYSNAERDRDINFYPELDSYTHSDPARASSTSSCGGAWTTG